MVKVSGAGDLKIVRAGLDTVIAMDDLLQPRLKQLYSNCVRILEYRILARSGEAPPVIQIQVDIVSGPANSSKILKTFSNHLSSEHLVEDSVEKFIAILRPYVLGGGSVSPDLAVLMGKSIGTAFDVAGPRTTFIGWDVGSEVTDE